MTTIDQAREVEKAARDAGLTNYADTLRDVIALAEQPSQQAGERERFEAWAREHFGCEEFVESAAGWPRYFSQEARRLWPAWQAATRLSEQPPAASQEPLIEYQRDVDGDVVGYKNVQDGRSKKSVVRGAKSDSALAPPPAAEPQRGEDAEVRELREALDAIPKSHREQAWSIGNKAIALLLKRGNGGGKP